MTFNDSPVIILDEAFRDLLPPLEAEELANLEEQMLATNGPTEKLVVWPTKDGSVLIDGHNRYDICSRNGYGYGTREIDFACRDEAMVWMIANQMGRRNLNAAQRAAVAAELAGIKTRLLEEDANSGHMEPVDPEGDTTSAPVKGKKKTKRDIEREAAKETGVGHETVRKANHVREHDSELARRMMKGDISVEQAYRQCKAEDSPDGFPEPDEDTTTFDTLGNPLHTDDAIRAFGADIDAIEEALKLQLKVQSILAKFIARAHSPGDWITSKQTLGRDIKNIKRLLKHIRPYCVCPECDGARCQSCRETGWLPKIVHDNLPPEKKHQLA